MAPIVLTFSFSSTVHSYHFSPFQLCHNLYRRGQASLKLLLVESYHSTKPHRSISQRCKRRLFPARSDLWIIRSGGKGEMLWDITQLVNENHMQEWQETGRNLFRDGIFFHSLHRLKKLMYFSFSHHVPIFTSNWESRAPTDQWSPCRAYVNTKSLEELSQLSWNYIPEIHSVVNSNHFYS